MDGAYTLEARAYDAANNVKSTSIGVNVKNSAVADIIAPVVAITSPKDGTIISRYTKTVNIAVASSDNVKVTRIELYINGYLAATSTSGSPNFTWYTQNLAKGTYRLQAYAYDAAGNIGSSYRITVYK